MNKYKQKVLEFQTRAGENINLGTVTEIRRTLLREEIKELKEAIENNDRVEILDAICDILYVNAGTQNVIDSNYRLPKIETLFIYNTNIHVGVKSLLHRLCHIEEENIDAINELTIFIAQSMNFKIDTIKEALKRVHESNMSKFCNSAAEVENTLNFYKNKGIEAFAENFGIYRLKDKKLLKNVNYKKVYLEDLI